MTIREQAAREAERRYPKRRFVIESYVQNAFIAGAEWASTIDRAAEIAACWGTCEGCGTSRVRCARAATEPGVLKCCPDCNHVSDVRTT